MPCSPPMRSRASAPTFATTSGDAAAIGVVLLGIHAQDARGFRRPIAADEHRAEGDRHFAEDGARNAPAQRSLDAVEQLDDLDLAGEHRVERAVSALVNGEFSGTEMQVGGGLRETLELGNGERREQRNGPDVVNGQHGSVERGNTGAFRRRQRHWRRNRMHEPPRREAARIGALRS